MRTPSADVLFKTLYTLAAGDGREEALFGDSISLAEPVFEKMCFGKTFPAVYLEFPLLGKPAFDLLAGYTCVKPGDRFAPGAGLGCQTMFDFLASLPELTGETAACGFEMDLSDGETQHPGLYFQFHEQKNLIGPFLRSVGEDGRLSAYRTICERLPPEWQPAYVGIFPGRPETPTRIGGYLNKDRIKECGEGDMLAKNLRCAGFTAFDRDVLDRCRTFLHGMNSADFQFDILPDGSLSDVFGLAVFIPRGQPEQVREEMRTGLSAEKLRLLRDWGLADERTEKLAGAAYARSIPIETADGTSALLALTVSMNCLKVKFCGGKAHPAKFYFELKAKEL